MSQNGEKQLSFIGRFIDKYYLKQRPWIQSVTFILFVLLFAYGFINILNGKYVLKGNLWVQKPKEECPQHGGPCMVPGKYYDLKWGTEDFVTNSKGEYYVTLGFPEYLGALTTGNHEITFLKDEARVGDPMIVPIRRLQGEFADVNLQSKQILLPPEPGAAALHDNSGIIPTAWAAVSPGVYRLLVQGIRLSGETSKTDASFQLILRDSVIQMQDHSYSDAMAGRIPLIPDQNLDLGSNLFFPLPGVNQLPVAAKIRLVANENGVFQFLSKNDEEDFTLPEMQSVGQLQQVRGTKGSTMSLRIVFSQDIKLFRKSSLVSKKDELESELLDQGFMARWIDPPQGMEAETNALWTGAAVPFDLVQKLLKIAVDQGIGLKKIEYQYHFQTTSNSTEMQFGYSGACVRRPAIPPETLKKAIDATTEQAFRQVITPVSSCNAPTSRPSRRSR